MVPPAGDRGLRMGARAQFADPGFDRRPGACTGRQFRHGRLRCAVGSGAGTGKRPGPGAVAGLWHAPAWPGIHRGGGRDPSPAAPVRGRFSQGAGAARDRCPARVAGARYPAADRTAGRRDRAQWIRRPGRAARTGRSTTRRAPGCPGDCGSDARCGRAAGADRASRRHGVAAGGVGDSKPRRRTRFDRRRRRHRSGPVPDFRGRSRRAVAATRRRLAPVGGAAGQPRRAR